MMGVKVGVQAPPLPTTSCDYTSLLLLIHILLPLLLLLLILLSAECGARRRRRCRRPSRDNHDPRAASASLLKGGGGCARLRMENAFGRSLERTRRGERGRTGARARARNPKQTEAFFCSPSGSRERRGSVCVCVICRGTQGRRHGKGRLVVVCEELSTRRLVRVCVWGGVWEGSRSLLKPPVPLRPGWQLGRRRTRDAGRGTKHAALALIFVHQVRQTTLRDLHIRA
jgi:hypothetical protein